GPGMPVRVRGVDAGEVVAVEYPDHDGPGAEVTVRLRVKKELADRLYGDAAARVLSGGVFGAKVVAIDPGHPGAGPLAAGRLKGLPPAGLDQAVAEARAVAAEVKALAADVRATSAEARGLLKDVRDSDGTFNKLVKDDDLYHDLKGLTADARAAVRRVDTTVGSMQGEVASLKGFVADGRDTLRSVKQGTDAISKMPVIRSYVEDAAGLLVRPSMRRERKVIPAGAVFQAKSAILSPMGVDLLNGAADWVAGYSDPRAEVVVVAYSEPADPDQTPASALEMTRKQAEVAVEFFRSRGLHKLGWTARRKMTPLGMGQNPSPVVEHERLPGSNLQVLLFSPP
ncbi:MCE family protein, partial [bacterium]|nr:MCE family protein [bacterium]